MFARTKRLLLRPGWIEDAPALSRAIGDKAIVGNLERAPWPYALGDAEAFLRAPEQPALPNLLIFLRTSEAPRLIGGVGFQRNAASDVELGYWIARDHWGRGFATEAGHAAMAIARGPLRLARIVARHGLDNPASGRILRKLGFVASGAVETVFSRGRGCEIACALFVSDAPSPATAAAPDSLAA